MNSWRSDNDDWGIKDIFGDSEEDYDEFDDFEAYDELINKEIEKYYREKEKEVFENKPKHGKSAHAYSHHIDNIRIIQMRRDNYTLREIAKQFNCSPSTIRNRLNKMGLK